MSPPQFYGGDDVVLYLKTLAEFSRDRPGWGPQFERSLERLIEAILRREEHHKLTLRDSHRDIESLETDLRRVRGY